MPERPPQAVVLAEAGRATLARTIEAVGTTNAAESVTMTAKASGRIASIGFTDGQQVAAGDVLVRLEQDEVKAELATVEAEAGEVRQQFERAEELLSKDSGPRATVDDARRRLQAAASRVLSARKRFEDSTIVAPFAGRVGLRDISRGAFVEPGTVLATLDAISPMDLRFTVPERYLGRVRPGTEVSATAPAFPERRFSGRVQALASRVDPALRTIAIEARLPNPEGALVPGMLMNVTIAIETVEAVVVPPMAVLVRGDGHFVYTVSEDGKAARVEVEIGQRDPDRIEVARGLEAGRRVVVEGLTGVTDGKPVRVIEPKAGPGEAKPGGRSRRPTPVRPPRVRGADPCSACSTSPPPGRSSPRRSTSC